MREEIFEQLTEDEIEFLKILSYRLNNQDQRCTAYPVWQVCDVKRKYGVSDDIADGYCVVNFITNEVYLDNTKIIEKIIRVESDKLDIEFGCIEDVLELYNMKDEVNIHSLNSLFGFVVKTLGWENYSYYGYIEYIEIKATFMTEKEAESFLEDNKYKYSEEAYIYVESVYGNVEMMMLIDILKKLKS